MFKIDIPKEFPKIAKESVTAWTIARSSAFGNDKKSFAWVANDPVGKQLQGIIFWLYRIGLLPLSNESSSLFGRVYYQNQARWLSWQNSLINVLKEFSEAGVAWMPLKGLALQPYIYPDPGMRWIGDFDLLVKPASFLPACHVLGKLGILPVSHYADSFNKLLKNPDSKLPAEIGFRNKEGLTIDLHSSLNDVFRSQSLYHIDTEGIWARSNINGPFAKLGGSEMQFEDTLAYLCFHLGKHGMGAYSFHSFLDIDLWIRNFENQLDWGTFVERVREWRVRPMAWFIMNIFQRFLYSNDGQLKTRSSLEKYRILQSIDPGYITRRWINFWIDPELLFFYQHWRRHFRPSLVTFIMAEPSPGTIKVLTQMIFPSNVWRTEHFGRSVSLIKYWWSLLKVLYKNL